MNDRFKFRAYWHNDVFNKWMIYENPELITGDGTCRVFENGEGGADEWRENVILCQCTGLKDKNGKLIYEGDIVDKLCELDETGIVRWENEEAKYVIDDEINRYQSSFENYYGEDLEIIGNIYENPELHKVK